MSPISPMGLISPIGLIIIITENIMKRQLIFYAARKAMVGSVMLLAVAFSAYGNTTETVEQVKGTVTLTEDVDYVITSATPFASGAVVDIVNTEKATIVFSSLKPSKVSSFYGNIRINGQKASAANCQARIHGDGAILLPYAEGKPLTVYTEKDQQGESAQYGVSTRQSLRNSPMNNRIKSFTLKRGYMAWFATKADGMGYNRVFIADKEPISVNLPTILSNSISALRVSKWNDASKKGYAGWDPAYNDPLNTTWCYSWDAGINIWTDREYVTQQHHRDKGSGYWWPSFTEVGNNGTSANVVTYNEPDNTGDDREHPATVQQVLEIWPQLMATGRRLGSPAVSGNYAWLYEFMDSIDARGWRCDFVVVHAYWYNDWPSWKSQLSGIRNRTGRPLWITEMNYGANWTGWPGSDRTGSDANYAIQTQHMNPVIDGLEDTPWLERYAIYNWVEDCRMVIDGKMQLTPFGKYYANKPSNIAYDSRYEVVPKLPKMYGPSNFSIKYDSDKGVASLTWYEPNGEYNESMTIQRSADGKKWEDYAEIAFEEEGAHYEFVDQSAVSGYMYRLHMIDATGKSYITRSVKAVPSKVSTGMAMSVDNKVYYAGGNRFVNGDFDLGFMSWTAGDGTPLSEPYFHALPVGGYDGGAYLQAYGDGGTKKEQSVLNVFDIEPYADYYFSGASQCSGLPLMRLCFTSGDNKEDSVATMMNGSTTWLMQSANFNSGSFSKIQLSLRMLSAGAQIDKLTLCRLFETKEEAYADGLKQTAVKAQAMAAYLEKDYPGIAAELREAVKSDVTDYVAEYEQLNAVVMNAVQALKDMRTIDSLSQQANKTVLFGLPGCVEVRAALDKIEKCSTSADYIDACSALRSAMDSYMPLSASGVKVVNGDFANGDNGWTVKCGTFTGGDQRVATHGSKTAWNAWWSGLNASEGTGKTMEIRQTIEGGFEHGLYVLECKAATQHFCLSDQHAYMVHGNDTVVSPVLATDYLDLPTVAEAAMWQTLHTAPVYLADGDTVSFGFVGSKLGATDDKWWRIGDKTYAGDKREGWWCATDFVLRYSPLYRVAAPAGSWGVICLPRAITVSGDTHLYKIVGITSDYKNLCLEETAGVAAGEPAVYFSTDTEVNFFESGDAVRTAITDEANLRGNFVTSARARLNSYVLQNGEWQRVTSSFRPYMEDYSGILMKTVGLPVHDSWAGKTLPIIGATEEYADGIEGVEAENGGTTAVYDLGGRKAVRNNGVMLNVNGKQVKKVLGGK